MNTITSYEYGCALRELFVASVVPSITIYQTNNKGHVFYVPFFIHKNILTEPHTNTNITYNAPHFVPSNTLYVSAI